MAERVIRQGFSIHKHFTANAMGDSYLGGCRPFHLGL